ncbi:MAG: hypothetical protein ACK4HE_01985 [Chitinophagaceae bacterium]
MDLQAQVTFAQIKTLMFSYIKVVRLRIVWFLLLGLLGGGFGYIYVHYIYKPKYTGNLSFVLSGGDGKAGSLSGLAAQFGFDIGTSGIDAPFAGEGIIQLLSSKLMIRKALFEPRGNNQPNLFTVLVESEGLIERWKSKAHLVNELSFNKLDTLQSFTARQDSLISSVIEGLIKKRLLSVERVDKRLGYYRIVVVSKNEDFSIAFPQILAEQASAYYIETKTRSARKNLSLLQRECDSLQNLLGGSISATAVAIDKIYNLNPALQRERTVVQKGQVNNNVLTLAYSEVFKNLELAKLALQKETPLFQIIDVPDRKLLRERPRVIFMGTQFALIFCFIALFVFHYRMKKRGIV